MLSGINQFSHDDLHVHLRDWFQVAKVADKLTVCYDSEHDKKLFSQIFNDRPPSYIGFRNIGSRNIIELLRYEFHTKSGLPEHHALNDALANRYAFRERPATI